MPWVKDDQQTSRRSSEGSQESVKVKKERRPSMSESVAGSQHDDSEPDWALVLKQLQREKKRAQARDEEQYVNRSMFCLQSSSRIREFLIKICEWPWFNRIVLILILLNCCFLVLDDPVCKCLESDCTEQERYTRLLYNRWDCGYYPARARLLEGSEYVFTVLFTLEMVVKIIARGFIFHKHAYLREAWNWLDFVVVVASLVSLSSSFGNVQFLRTVRVLRPLRTMTRIKGMRPLINTFMRSFKALGNVLMLLAFFFVVYGILGIELLGKSLRGKCFFDPQNNNFTAAALARLESQQTPYLVQSTNLIGARNGDTSFCSVDYAAGAGMGQGCDPSAVDGVSYNTVCSHVKWCFDHWCERDYNENPFATGAGFFSYDNIGQACLSIFQTLTLEGWVDLMYMHGDGYNHWGSRIYHSSWVFLGAFFVVQLALAVLSDSFLQAQEEEKTEKEREALHDQAILKRFVVAENETRKEGPTTRMMNRIRTASVQLQSLASSVRGSSTLSSMQGVKSSTLAKFQYKPRALVQLKERVVTWVGMLKRWTRMLIFTPHFQRFIIVAIIANTVLMAVVEFDGTLYESSLCKRRCQLDPAFSPEEADRCTGPLFNRTFVSDGLGGGERPVQEDYCFLRDDESCSLLMTEAACIEAESSHPALHGQQCHWVHDQCMPGVYNSSSFAQLDDGRTISLRHLCGDDNKQCDSFPPATDAALQSANLVLTAVFIAEMALKLFGLGLLEYFDDKFNQFDFLVVISSIVELIVDAQSGGEQNGGSVSALRGMRLFRLFKLARSWKSMRQILKTLGVALASLGPLTIVWVMFMYIFALLGMQFLGGRFRYYKTDAPRSNFDSFFPSLNGHGAFIVTFQMISTENWNTIMYNSVTSVRPYNGFYALLPISVVVFGNYIIMNLFISILLQGFGEEDEEDEGGGTDSGTTAASITRSASTVMMSKFRKLLGKPANTNSIAPSTGSGQGLALPTTSPLNNAIARNMRPPGAAVSGPQDGNLNAGAQASGTTAAMARLRSLGQSDARLRLDAEIADSELEGSVEADRTQNIRAVVFGKERDVKMTDHTSFMVLSETNPLRVYISFFVHHRHFESFILVCIIITSLTLLLERPDDWIVASHCPSAPAVLDCSGLSGGQTEEINCPRNEDEETFGKVWGACGSDDEPACCTVKSRFDIFEDMDRAFTVVFLLEMLFKMLADGFLFHRHAYLRSPWNWLDCFIVVISMISSFGSAGSIKSLKALRTVRALRPLRVIKRNPGLKVAVVSLLSSIPAMLNVLVVVLLWFSMYAMLGVNFFQGQMFSCYNPESQIYYGTSYFQASSLYTPPLPQSGPDAVPTIVECVAAGGGGVAVWMDKPFTFNSYPQALLTLFEMSTTEGWMEVMAACTDAVGTGITPIPNTNPWMAIYCAAHIIIGAFVLLNLIVGSVINNYNKIKSQNDGISPLMTPEQQEWKETQRIMADLKPKRRQQGPTNKVRYWCFKLSVSEGFEVAITAVILLNVISMTLKHHNQSDCFSAGMFYANVAFTIIFISEAVIKLVGLGPRWYFLDRWNVFDFVVVLLSIATLCLDLVNGEHTCGGDSTDEGSKVNIPGLQILRAFRIARVFRLIRRAKGLRQMIQTLLVSLPSLGNIAALLLLIIIIFAVLGITFFYNINTEQDFYGRMDEIASYTYFDSAIWLLHRQTTGEAWNGIMYYCSNPDWYQACSKAYGDYLNDGCGGPTQGIIYHVLWQLFGTYVMMQLFTAVILENFHELATADAAVLPIDKLNEFVDVWTELDPGAYEEIEASELPRMIVKLSPPLGVKDESSSRVSVLQVIKDLEIPIRHNKIRYKETFTACVKRVLAMEVDVDDLIEKQEDAEGDNEENESAMQFRGRCVTAAEDYAARSVQNAYREYREKRLQVIKAARRTTNIPLEHEQETVNCF